MASIYSRYSLIIIICYFIFLCIFILIQTMTFANLENRAPFSIETKGTSGTSMKVNKKETFLSYFHVYRDLYMSDTNDTLKIKRTTDEREASVSSPSLTIPLVIVVCNSDGKLNKQTSDDDIKSSWQRQETQIRTMLGTLLLFSKSPKWRIIVITDSWRTFYSVLNLTYKWPFQIRKQLKLERYPRDYEIPSNGLLSEWRPCSWAKIFLADLLTDLDFVVYIDTDFIFLGPAEDLWLEINNMNKNHILGIGQEAWYSYENDRHFAGQRGLNTGVLLMNLTRARNVKGESFSQLIMKEITNVKNPRHDQDVVNSYLENNKDLFLEISPRFNFLPSTCMLNVVCPDCEEKGVVAFHGADGSFFSTVDPRWRVIYGILTEVTRNLAITYSSLLALLKSQLYSFQASKVKGSCSDYSQFNNMILKALKEN